MDNDLDRCNKLQRLHERLVEEVNHLNEEVRIIEREGVGNPTGTHLIIKSLQSSLHTIHLELQNCPPEDRPTESPASMQQTVKSIHYTAKAFIPEEVKAAESFEHEGDEGILDIGQ